jgi:hypothetical protein
MVMCCDVVCVRGGSSSSAEVIGRGRWGEGERRGDDALSVVDGDDVGDDGDELPPTEENERVAERVGGGRAGRRLRR